MPGPVRSLTPWHPVRGAQRGLSHTLAPCTRGAEGPISPPEVRGPVVDPSEVPSSELDLLGGRHPPPVQLLARPSVAVRRKRRRISNPRADPRARGRSSGRTGHSGGARERGCSGEEGRGGVESPEDAAVGFSAPLASFRPHPFGGDQRADITQEG